MINYSSKGLNNTTFGFAMTFMQEVDHTNIGSEIGNGTESTTFVQTDTVLDSINKYAESFNLIMDKD